VALLTGGLTACANPTAAPTAAEPTAAEPTAAETAAAPASADPNATLGLGITGLIVADVPRSLAFYRRLGIPIPEGVTGDSYRLPLATGQVFFWDTETLTRSWDPGWTPRTGSRRVVLEFGFATPAAVDAKYADMVAAGYPGYRPPGDLFGSRYAIVVDPDGNQIALRNPLAS